MITGRAHLGRLPHCHPPPPPWSCRLCAWAQESLERRGESFERFDKDWLKIYLKTLVNVGMPRTGSASPLPPLGSPHTRLRLAQVVIVVVVVVVVVVVQTNSQPQDKQTWRNKCNSKTELYEGLNRPQHPMEIASTSLENGGGSCLCWTSTCSASETIRGSSNLLLIEFNIFDIGMWKHDSQPYSPDGTSVQGNSHITCVKVWFRLLL